MLAATAVLLTLCFVITFIATVLGIRSVLELRELVVDLSGWMSGMAPSAAGEPLRMLAQPRLQAMA